MIRDLILKNRSYRRFYQEVDIKRETLRELVDLARLSGSARNAQPLKYILSCEPQRNSLIFPHLAWAPDISRAGPIPVKGKDHQHTLLFSVIQK
jgi:nitroreductase